MRFIGSQRLLTAVFIVAPVFLSGCSEGPFSGLGAYSPWVRKKWAEEEQYVQSLYGRRDQLRNLTSRAKSMTPAEQERVSRDLARLFREDPIVLLRIEAIKTLTVFPTQTATNVLKEALKDSDADIRLEACRAWGERQDPQGIAALHKALGSDTEIDVRLAATRALGKYQDPRAVNALSIALEDSNPAMQYRAMESLRMASGENRGMDIVAWRDYLRTASRPDVN